MNPSSSQRGGSALNGAMLGFLAEALIIPTGLLSAAILTRQLGAEGYGLFTLAVTIVSWIQWMVASAFTRATIKLVSEAEDWRPVGATVMRLHLAASGGAALLLCLLAVPVAALLHEPVLARYLWLLSIDIPLFTLAYAHRNILVGVGEFRQRAIITASRWIARLLLIALLVGCGFSVTGAILGSIGASLVELGICRLYIRPSLFHRSTFPARQMWNCAVPLFLFALTMRCFDKLDLFTLKALGGTAEQAGIYGAAQNLALGPSIFALAFSPILLSTLSRMLREGNQALARQTGRKAMRGVLLMLPLAGLTAGAAVEIVSLIYGPLFASAAPLLACLIFGAVALVMISVATAILTAAGKAVWTFALAVPLPFLAIVGHLLLIPRMGAIGASLVTTCSSSLVALASVAAVYRLWRVLPLAGTLWKSVLVCVLAYVAAAFWHAPGFWLCLKLPLISAGILLSFKVLGEFDASEVALLRSFLRWPGKASLARSPVRSSVPAVVKHNSDGA